MTASAVTTSRGMITWMAVLRLFASAREAAGTTNAEIPGSTVAEVLEQAEAQFGQEFVAVLAISRVWLNGEQVDRDTPVSAADEVAVLPPVSGG
ncbi:MAG: MoaD/ThiS family protein [Acidimicrobiales bacterium]